MFDEFRLVTRQFGGALKQTPLHDRAPYPTSSFIAAVQGLVLGLNCRTVVDTDFGRGYVAAAIGLAFRRLPPSDKKPSYVAISDSPDEARFVYTLMRRRYVAWMPYVQIRLGKLETALASVSHGSIDLGIVERRATYAEVLADVRLMAPLVRRGGHLLVNVPDTVEVNPEWNAWKNQTDCLAWDLEGPSFLCQMA